MKKMPIYSRKPPPSIAASPKPTRLLSRHNLHTRWQSIRHNRILFFIAGILLSSCLFFSWSVLYPKSKPLTQDIIDEAVLKTLSTKELP